MGFRPASPDESAFLGSLVLDGIRHWGHDVNFPEAFAGLQAHGLPTSEFIEEQTVEVLDDANGAVGFYSLADRGDGVVELVHMFASVERIGTGCGRRLWERSLDRARGMGDRILIMSDPAAKGFYAAMGATLECDVEVAPRFSLGRMWFELA